MSPRYVFWTHAQCWPRRSQSSSTSFQILIPLLTVPEGHTDTQSHESNWRNQQNQHASADGTLAFFGSTRGVAVAHRAALGESRRHPEQQHQTERGQSQLHFTPKWIMRYASGQKM